MRNTHSVTTTVPTDHRLVIERLAAAIRSRFRTRGLTIGDRWIGCRTRISWASWGEDIHVDVTRRTAGSSAVTITSTSVLPVVRNDWGTNRRNVERLLGALYDEP